MRQIKFRAWNGERIFDCEIVSDGEGYETWFDFEDGLRKSKILMQFTGLKDKNGKDIYEWDIIQWNNPECKGVIKFGEYCGTDYYDYSNYGFYIDHLYDDNISPLPNTSPFEVIGNVYDNPSKQEHIITLCKKCHGLLHSQHRELVSRKALEEQAKQIFDKFDKYSCIKNDEWYLELKKKWCE